VAAFGRYAYALGNPYRSLDPDGRQPKDARQAITGSKIKNNGIAAGVRVAAIGGALPSGFTKENAQARYDAMKGVVDATKVKMESIPNANSDNAAKIFSKVYQKYSVRFGWEVSAEIVMKNSGAFHLSDIGISSQVRDVDWLGGTAGRPLVGGSISTRIQHWTDTIVPTRHSHIGMLKRTRKQIRLITFRIRRGSIG